MTNPVPAIRIQTANTEALNPRGRFVLYWMITSRRTRFNFALQRAVEWSRELKKPLVILEALRCGYRWASDRLHAFVLQGMADNARQLARKNVTYHPYVEGRPGEGKGLVSALARQAAVIVTDEYPGFFLPRMVSAAANQVPVLLEQVDSNGLLPMRAADRTFTLAFHFRRFLQNNLRWHLEQPPRADPFAGARLPKATPLPRAISGRWPQATSALLSGAPAALASLPIDHSVNRVPLEGGGSAARKRLKRFLDELLHGYAERRNHPDHEHTSGLSPYLHFGHISVHEVLQELFDASGGSVRRLSSRGRGGRAGWWKVGPDAEAFLDQLVTWREIGFNLCSRNADYDHYQSLPVWARQTLEEHAGDPRKYVYRLGEFEEARTHDAIWNAAQTQLVREGRMHNYLRMLWGKKILEWTASPRDALAIMIELNDRYALDGRDPNSTSGIFWILGRYDRAWGPERPVFGKVRYMSSASTARKVRLRNYLKKYPP